MDVTKEFEKQLSSLGETTEKCRTFTVTIRKLQEFIQMEKKLQKIYLTFYNLLKAQDLWQAYYQILSITFPKEFIKLNVNTDTMMKK